MQVHGTVLLGVPDEGLRSGPASPADGDGGAAKGARGAKVSRAGGDGGKETETEGDGGEDHMEEGAPSPRLAALETVGKHEQNQSSKAEGNL